MSKAIKFTKDEIKNIQELQQLYNAMVTHAGQVYLEELSLDKKKDQVEINFKELSGKESGIISELTTKYGQGQINLETGEFTPTSDEE